MRVSFKKSFCYLRVVVTRLLFVAVLGASAAYIAAYTPVFSFIGRAILSRLPVPQTPHSYNNEGLHIPSAYVVLGGGLTEYGSVNNYARPTDITADMTSLTNLDLLTGDLRPMTQLTPDPDDAISTRTKTTTNSSKKSVFRPIADDTIVLNHYSLSRLNTALKHYRSHPLPIVVTGVEAPWMKEWLVAYGVDKNNVITENASMNTCENARFTAKRLRLLDVFLVTDAYHMTRAQRQFALNDIYSIPLPAPLPIQTRWKSPSSNLLHSRRTVYELLAYARDVFRPQENCRQAEDVSIETLKKSRRSEDVETF